MIVLVGCLSIAQPAEVVSLNRLKRDPPKLPGLSSTKPLYGLFLFGERGEKRVWAVLDESRPQSSTYDVLFLDLNGDEDLTQPNERFVAGSRPARLGDEVMCKFEIGRFTEPPDTQEVHPHGSGVLEQDSVGGGALGHRRDVGEVHGRETNHHHQHQAMPRKVAPS